ncbi:hypothetical protein GGF46_001083 [Coemansia sp. RSA 552]|nr:hypothetical protein GGF46_001083 [Coemansia sp. RSA 552]
METTYRPVADSTDSATYIPMPLTPDLAQIANSITAEPSVAEAMRQARTGWEPTDGPRDEL